MDAALTLRLTKLVLAGCRMGPASAAALPRLLRGNALLELAVGFGNGITLLDAHAASLLTEALRSNRMLTSLELTSVGLWQDVDAAATLFGALVGHASLTRIAVFGNRGQGAEAGVCALLGALVAADSPQLRMLNFASNELGDAGLRPLVDALPRNTHLQELICVHNSMSAAFALDRLMPALTANTSLRRLISDNYEANEFISARTAAMVTAD